MKILFYNYNSFNVNITCKHLTELGHCVETLSTPCTDYNSDMKLASIIIERINSEHFDAFFSYNYYPIIAIACNVCNIPYYSWVYDSPHLTLFSKSVFYPTNHIGIFDQKLADKYRNYGVNNAYHIPLAIDSEDMLDRIRNSHLDLNRYSSDISFVGSMYTDSQKRNYYDVFKSEADFSLDYISDFWNNLDSAISRQCFNKETDLISNSESIDYSYLEQLMNDSGATLGNDYFASSKDIVVTSVLEKQVTVCERQMLIESIANYCHDKHDFKLYTNSDVSHSSYLQNANYGIVDYQKEMPFVFRNSKINLHISLKSIRSGIPLRALDILSSGGFLLCDAQAEILENFIDGVHLAIYHTPDECIEKIEYYLKNDKERAAIAHNGQKKAMELFNYNRMLTLLLNESH